MAALVDAINQAQAERAAAHAELNQRPSLDLLGADDVTKMIDELGDVGQVLDQAEPQDWRIVRVCEGTCTLTTRLELTAGIGGWLCGSRSTS